MPVWGPAWLVRLRFCGIRFYSQGEHPQIRVGCGGREVNMAKICALIDERQNLPHERGLELKVNKRNGLSDPKNDDHRGQKGICRKTIPKWPLGNLNVP